MSATHIVAKFQTPDGSPQRGYVEFRLAVEAYQDTLDAVVTAQPVIAEIADDGTININLEPTSGDDADFTMTGLSYRVTEVFFDERGKTRGKRKYYVDIPTSDGDVDLGALATYAAAPGITVNDALAATVAALEVTVDDHIDDDTVHVPSTAGADDGQVLSWDGDSLVWADQSAEGVTAHNDLSGRSADDAHPQSAITGLDSALAGKASSVHTHAHADTTSRDAADSHPQSAITGLVSALAGKAASSHTHAESDITGLVSDLAGKAASTHTHTGIYDVAGAASDAVAAHVADSDPHPGYLTPTEGNAAYAPIAGAVPTGSGTSGQVLIKGSGTAFAWGNPPAPTAPVVIQGLASAVQLRVNGFDGQTANLFDVRRNVGGTYTAFLIADDDGNVKIGRGTATSDAALRIGQDDPSLPGFTVRMPASATADAVQTLDSSGAPQFKVGPDGFVTGLNIGPMIVVLESDEDPDDHVPVPLAGSILLREPEVA